MPRTAQHGLEPIVMKIPASGVVVLVRPDGLPHEVPDPFLIDGEFLADDALADGGGVLLHLGSNKRLLVRLGLFAVHTGDHTPFEQC